MYHRYRYKDKNMNYNSQIGFVFFVIIKLDARRQSRILALEEH